LLSFPNIIAYAEAPPRDGVLGLSGRIDPGVCSPPFWLKPTWEVGREKWGTGFPPIATLPVVLYAINCQKCTWGNRRERKREGEKKTAQITMLKNALHD